MVPVYGLVPEDPAHAEELGREVLLTERRDGVHREARGVGAEAVPRRELGVPGVLPARGAGGPAVLVGLTHPPDHLWVREPAAVGGLHVECVGQVPGWVVLGLE